MKLRNKILIIISLAWVAFLSVSYLGTKYFLIRSFLALEQQRANDDLGRVDQVVQQINRSLFTFASDWAHWNDLYAYTQGTNPQFITNNLTMPAFINANLNFITIWNADDQLLFGAAIENHKLVPYQEGLSNYIYHSSRIFDRDLELKTLSGYILVKQGIMLIAAAPITDGERKNPISGTAVFGINMSQTLINKINDITKSEIVLLLPDEIDKDPTLRTIFHKHLTQSKSGHYNDILSPKLLMGYTVIKDIFGNPIGMFRITNHRTIYQTGLNSVQYYLTSFIILAILFSLLLLWLLRILIIARLETLDKEIAHIGNKHAIKDRVTINGRDELTSVSVEINKMLDIIQLSQETLEQRVAERTEELQNINIALQKEIAERKSVEAELTIHKEHLVRLAHYDNLTSLPNRVFFNEILNKAIQNATETSSKIAILFIDLDRFKNINDALGHTVGDQVLKEISTRFSNALTPEDNLARLGGDEFIIIVQHLSENIQADLVADKILTLARQPVVVDGHELFISASIGISIYPDDGNSMEALLKNADMAMYKSKHDGGGVVNFYIQTMDKTANDNLKMEAALRRAIVNNEFRLYFQPQLDLHEGKVKRAEALIRWEDPELGLIKPDSFIPLAEDTGLIIPIGEWALHEACRINKAWSMEGYDPIIIAVNISSKQFHHQDIAQVVSSALTTNDLDPRYLEVEITESAVMDNVTDAIIKLKRIKAMGVHISIDDFGTGYTSINYLRQYPVSILKIDQTFIKGLPSSQNDAAITSAVIALGHNLGLKIVAEGVETAEQVQFLFDQGCDLIQGYYISRPLPEDKFIEEFLKINTDFANHHRDAT